MSEQLKYDRRRFLSAAAITIAAGPLVMLSGAATAQPVQSAADFRIMTSGTNNSFGEIKQINEIGRAHV